MSPPGAAAPVPELDELAVRLAELTAGGTVALRDLRPALHRVVVASSISGAVKTLVVQALLLIDDPRLVDGTPSHGAPLLLKIRKLLESALAAHATSTPTPSHGIAITRAEFSPDALLSPDTDAMLVAEFVSEAREQLAIAESALLALDGDPSDMHSVDVMFRALHTIKGTSAFLGVEHATELAHHAESLLVKVRGGMERCAGEVSNLLFRAIDMLDAIIVAIESAHDGEVALLPDGFRPLLEVLRSPEKHADPGLPAPRVSGAIRRLRSRESMLRVRAADLDRLSDIVHELRLTQSMLARDTALRSPVNAELARKIAHAESLVEEIEQVANDLRTVRFGVTLQKLTRLARDTARASGKSVELALEGDDLMIERATAEGLAEALVHMVRNAIDHGIEGSEVRERVGKAPAGRLAIGARLELDELVVVIADDGRGLDARRLTLHAIDRGILSPGMELSEREAFSLILRPGFTTAPIVTDLSGRGVGMDVVRSNVETLGGTIDIESRAGVGTTFTIRLPFRTVRARNVETWGEAPETIGLIA
jgi:two-component system chemotaxis sensor kinase CheA